MGRKNQVKSAAWPALLLLVVMLALMIRLRTLPVKTPEATPAAPVETAPALASPTDNIPKTEPTAVPASTPVKATTDVETFQPGPLRYTEESYRVVSDLVYTYAARQREGENEIQTGLARLQELDPRLGALWEEILQYWDFVNEDFPAANTNPPEDLPRDDSLCIVVLGFQLHADGSMAEELVGRCETALRFAEAYPEAFLAVTGGGTAWQNKTVTEAGAMAQWLMERGIAEERILVEDRSLTTADNAVFTCEILRRQAPQVKTLAIVSSDYHLPLGALLFEEKALLLGAEEGEKPFSVESFAAYDTQGRFRPDTPMEQKAYVWSVADPQY